MSFCVFAPPRHLFFPILSMHMILCGGFVHFFFFSGGDPVFITAKIILILDHFCQTAFSFNFDLFLFSMVLTVFAH